MLMRPRIALTLAVSVALVAGLAASADSGTSTRSASAALGHAAAGFHRSDASAFSGFALYWLGEGFEGLPLIATTRRDEPLARGEKVRADYVGFIYGDCLALDENGCAPPLEVQAWPACVRSLGDYTLTPGDESLPHEPTTVRGVPAAFFEDGLRLELYTSNVSVVIFGLARAQVQRAAAALRAANALASSAPKLPPPVPGALAGTLACDP